MGKWHPVGYYHDDWIIAHHVEYRYWKDFLDAYLALFEGNRNSIRIHCIRKFGIQYEYPKERYDEEWLLANWDELKNWRKLTDKYNDTFGKNISYGALKSYCNRHLGLNFKYTDEQKQWLRENYPSIGSLEIGRAFNNKFGTTRTDEAVFVECKKLGIKVSEERMAIKHQQIAEVRKQPIGQIMPREHGKLYIKTANGWKRMDELVIGRKNGKIIIHLDGDQTNLAPENLMHIDRATSIMMAKNNFWSEHPEITRTGVVWCDLNKALKKQGVDVEQVNLAE